MGSRTAISPKRIYEQVYELLRERIVAGDYAVGDQLPTVAELGEETGVSHVTAFKALNRLVREGYAKSVNGKARGRRGTFVASRNPRSAPLDMRRVLTLLLPREAGSATDQYWYLTLCAIQRHFSERNILTAGYSANDAGQTKQFLRDLRNENVRGVMLSNFSDDEVVEKVVGLRIPLVMINRELDIPGVNCVLTDYGRMIEESVERLAGSGFKKFFFFRLPRNYRRPSECREILEYWSIVRMADLFEEKVRRLTGGKVSFVHDLPKDELMEWCRSFLADPEACVFSVSSSLPRFLGDLVDEGPEWRRRHSGVIGIDEYVVSPAPVPFARWRIDLAELGLTAAKTLENMDSGGKNGKVVKLRPVFISGTG